MAPYLLSLGVPYSAMFLRRPAAGMKHWVLVCVNRLVTLVGLNVLVSYTLTKLLHGTLLQILPRRLVVGEFPTSTAP